MNRIIKFFSCLLLLINIIIFIGCNKIAEPINTNLSIGEGSGGPVTINGQIKTKDGKLINSSTLYIYNSLSYIQEITKLDVKSPKGYFTIKKLPLIDLDIIIDGDKIFTSKISNKHFSSGLNDLEIIVNEIDQELPKFHPNIVVLAFKDKDIDSLSVVEFLNEYNCTLFSVQKSPALEDVLYSAKIPNDKTVPEMLREFGFDQRIKRVKCSPLYTITN